MTIAAWLLLALVAGSGVYCILVIVAAQRYLAVPKRNASSSLAFSVLKPLAGADEGLRENLRSFFAQQYAVFEIIAAVRNEADPAAAVFRSLQEEFPLVPSRLLVTGEPPYPNAKVWSLERMTAEASNDLLVMSDSDIRVTPDMLSKLAAEFEDPRVGLSTCPYRAVPGRSLWSKLEAAGMNTEFLSGVLVARMLEGMHFALGPTIAARRQAISDAGGWPFLAEFLAEDFVFGKLAAEKGWTVLLSQYVIEHRIGSQSFLENATHRLRWYRSTRRSRPAGYVGQLFTNPLPLALLLCLLRPDWVPVFLLIAALRGYAAMATAGWILHDPLTRSHPLLVPLQDVLSFFFWMAGFWGNTILWRGRKYRLLKDGRFTLSAG